MMSPAAEQGDSRAQCNLGLCYLMGDGVEANKEEALRLLKLSAEQGNEEAQKALQNQEILK